jgi:hypothetical protein
MSPAGEVLIRVTAPGRQAFQLRKGELGISVFDPNAVDPVLTEAEVIAAFRPGSQALVRSRAEIEAEDLRIEVIAGADFLPDRLRLAHREIRAGQNMTRQQFKDALKELE